ncbi:MAG TPA: DMT family transporter [Acidimicrobiales bacterium]
MTRRGWLLFSMMAVLWGIPYLLIRVAVRQLDPGVVVLGRTAPAALLLLPVVLHQKSWNALVTNIKWIAVFGVAEFGVPWYLMSTAERHITSSLTSLIICAVPLFSVIASRFTSAHEPIGPRRLLGLGAGAGGVALLVGLDLKGGSITWIVFMLIVGVGYSIGPLILATKLRDVPGPAVVCGATGLVALAWVPYDVFHWPVRVDAETWMSMGILSVFCTAGAFLTFFALVKEAGSNRSVVVVYSNTAIAVVLGIVGLHEPFTVGIAVGFPLIVIGSYLATSVRTIARDHAGGDANLTLHD